MSEFLDEVAADCLEAERDLGDKLMSWPVGDEETEAQTYPVAQTLVRRGAVLVIGGKEVEIRLTLRVRQIGVRSNGQPWEFDTIPAHGQRVMFPTTNGTEYRIAQVNNAHGAFLEIDLMDKNR